MDLKSIICSTFVILAVFGSVCLSPVDARKLTPQTLPPEYHAARDRIEIGQVNDAILLLGDYLKNNPHHQPSVTLFFRYLDERTSDTVFKRAVKTHFSRARRTQRFLAVINSSSLSGSDKYDLLKWGGNELPATTALHNRTLRTAQTLGDSRYIRNRAENLTDQLTQEPGLTEFYADWHADNGNWDKASRLYRRLISLRPGYHRGYRGLARYNRREGHSNRAELLESRARALSADP